MFVMVTSVSCTFIFAIIQILHTTKHIFAAKIQFFRERCKKIHRNFADEDLFVAVKQLFLDAKYKKEGIYMPRLL